MGKGVFIVVFLVFLLLFSRAAQLYSVNSQTTPSSNTSTTAETNALRFLSNVARIDLTQYNVTLVSDETPSNVVNGAGQEQIRYKLSNSHNALDATWLFNNSKLVWFMMSITYGSPVFTEAQPDNLITKANAVLDNYANYTGASILDSSRFQTMKFTIDAAGASNDTTITLGDTKLAIYSEGLMKGFGWAAYNDVNGPGFSIQFYNGTLTSLDDHGSFFITGSTYLKVSETQAVAIALNELKSFSWTVGADAEAVTNFTLDSNAAQATSSMQAREDSTLYPLWRVEVPVSEFYVAGTLYYTNATSIVVGVWADTGAVSYIKALSYGGSLPEASNTSQLTSSLSATVFTPKTVFPITPNNGTIRFAYNGSYTNATLENNTWLFQNLIVNNYTISHIPAWSLAISTQNSNVTITSYSAGALTGLLDAAAWLNYTVLGNGTQTVNLNYDAIAGQTNLFVVYIDGVNRTQGSSWTVSDTLSLTISDATSNVSIYYPPNTFLDSFLPPSPSPSANSPSPSIPEFPSWVVLLLLLISVLVTSVNLRRRLKTQKSVPRQL